VPEGLDWDLWLGPAPFRPYHNAYLPFNWRGWWDFGTGALGDMACHIMDMPYWSLELGAPATEEAKSVEAASDDVMSITGQRPVITKASKSIANFKLREGRAIGVKVTLRGEKMWAFFDRLVNVALPRMRDFRGISPTAFDGRGNYTLGLREQLIFPEIVFDKIDKVRGMEITIVTTARTDDQARRLLTMLGMPFRKEG
jgi:large subunit ribosomal protein L5